MSNLEYIGQVKHQRLTSLEEDFKRDQDQFRKDELDRVFRRSGKVKAEVREITYERFPEEI